MSFEFKCPHCQSVRQAAEQIIGRRVRCADCNNFVQVPEFEQPTSSASSSIVPNQEANNMNNNPESEDGPDEEGFDLVPPTGRMKSDQSAERPPAQDSVKASLPVPPPVGALEDKKSMVWKGFEEEEDEDDSVGFVMKKDGSAEEMDMTPMVDVTFLLLIFFMITASFTLVRSVEQPKPNTDQPSKIFQDPVPDTPDYVEVMIDQHDTFHITTRSKNDVEAGSNLEMQRLIRESVENDEPERCVIIAHEQSSLKKLIAVYSAARVLGINTIQLQTTDRDY